jgi:hypothetical protein
VIKDVKIEYCCVKEYPNGDKFCMAKFMYEEDARNWKRSRKKHENVVWKVYERRERMDGVTWEELNRG